MWVLFTNVERSVKAERSFKLTVYEEIKYVKKHKVLTKILANTTVYTNLAFALRIIGTTSFLDFTPFEHPLYPRTEGQTSNTFFP